MFARVKDGVALSATDQSLAQPQLIRDKPERGAAGRAARYELGSGHGEQSGASGGVAG